MARRRSRRWTTALLVAGIAIAAHRAPGWSHARGDLWRQLERVVERIASIVSPRRDRARNDREEDGPLERRRPHDYDRDAWPHWLDTDHDCQDTRDEVLIAESLEPVRFREHERCQVRTGRWRCPLTGEIFDDPHELDIDHLVPLHNAHASGGAGWSKKRKAEYANALAPPEHLIAVSRSANRAKGAKGPDEWLPPLPQARCNYVEQWVAIKERWSLSSTPAEERAIQRSRTLCSQGQVPRAPQLDNPAEDSGHSTKTTMLRSATR